MDFSFGCELSYRVAESTVFIFNIEAARAAAHGNLRESLALSPDLERVSEVSEPFGNRYTRLVAPPGPFSITCSGSVSLEPVRADPATLAETPIADMPLALFSYLQPSRFCESDRLAAFAAREFEGLAPGYSRVNAICNWIADHVDYRRGVSDALTSAAQTLEMRAGVCRDFAHLGIAFCRALGIPARLVSCYAFGLTPDDFHAVFEAWLGGHWWLFDPTRKAATDGLVRIGIGRDAAEVSFASIFGQAEPTGMRVWMDAADPAAFDRPRTTDAIRNE